MGAITGPELLKADAKLVFIELNKVIERSIITIDKLTKATIRLHAVKGTDKEARALTKVNKLTAEQLGLKEKTIALDIKHKAAQDQLNIALKKTAVSATGFSKALGAMGAMLHTLLGPMAILFALWQGIKNLKDTVVRLDSFRFALEKITDTSARTTESMRYLIDVANRFGVALNVAADRYVKFFTAAKQSGLAVEETRKIFSNMSKAAGVLGLKAHEVEGVFLALEQMLSKGKVTTEELRRQLGERLPGAFGVMAQAVGVSVNELDALLKKGQVLSAEMLPKFAEAYNKAFGIDKVERVETLQASISRFGTAWTAMIFEIEHGTSVFSKTFIGFFDGMSYAINTFSANMVIMGDETLSTYKKFRLLGLSGPAKIEIAGQLSENQDAKNAREELVLLMDGYYNLGELKKMINEDDLKYFKEGNNWLLKEKEALEDRIPRLMEALGINEMTTEDAINRMEYLKAKAKLNEDEVVTIKRTVDYLDKIIKKEKEELSSKYIKANLSEQELKDKVANLKLLEAERKTLAIMLGLIKDGSKAKDEWFGKNDDGFGEIFAPDPDSMRDLQSRLREVNEILDTTTFTNEEIKEIYEEQADSLQRQIDLLNDVGIKLKDIKEIIEPEADDERFIDLSVNAIDKYGNRDESSDGLAGKIFGGDGGDMASKIRFEEQYRGEINNTKKARAEYNKAYKEWLSSEAQLDKDKLTASIALTNQLFELGSAIFDAQLESIQAEMKLTEDKYDRMYDLAEGDKNHQKAIAKEKEFQMKKLEKEELKIKQKQAKYDKAQSIFNAIIGTAVAIAGAGNPFLIALYAAIGAAAIATIIAEPLPQYAQGRGMGVEEYAIVGDGGRPEIISGKRGVRKTPQIPTMTHLDKTDSVYPSERAYKDMVMRSIIHEVNTNFESKQIEEAIEKGFKKATVNNYIKMPTIKIESDLWAFQNSQFN